MRLGLFFRLACSNIKKNHQLYVPHILAGTGLTSIFYVMLTLANDNRIREIKGGYAIPSIMAIGIAVVAVLSVILVLFTNSFLMKQRTREYGMYNVLGMEKRHVGMIMFFENLISTTILLAGGILAGMLMYKLCCLFICKMLRVETILGFYMNAKHVLKTVGAFAAMYLVAFLWNCIRLARLRPVELIASAGAGEKEPKTKWIMLIIGLATLGTGYFIALTTDSPLQAIPDFFKAVILVIIGTYALFLAGSIALLKFLRRNKSFYYRRKNMIAVSDLLYRMKQNAIGLASIAILATGVIVMISTTVCLYVGIEDTVKNYFLEGQADMFVGGLYVWDEESPDGDVMSERHSGQIPEEELRKMTEQVVGKYGAEVESFIRVRSFSDTICFTDGQASRIRVRSPLTTLPKGTIEVVMLPLEDYNNLCKDNLILGENEIGWVALSDGAGDLTKKLPSEISFGGKSYTLGPEVKHIPIMRDEPETSGFYGLVVPTMDDIDRIVVDLYQPSEGGWTYYVTSYRYYVKLKGVKEIAARDGIKDGRRQSYWEFGDLVTEYLEKLKTSETDERIDATAWETSWALEDELLGMYGSLFFLGILLSMVFLFATALIIYYKQISEGYDDRGRFQILQKVGMTQKETKGTIRRQIVIVFFLPLVTAVIHMVVAYPVIRKLLLLLMMPNDKIFLLCTACTVVAFAFIYMVIYRLTARTYYRIVR
ncbi:MAG: ABC transporter permease [Lachnospiraceae bacterium]|nr:ABC transporter permease [Lachnospiraceae bacterium]